MLNSERQSPSGAGEQDRRDGTKPGNRFLGRVVACNGSRATIAAVAERGETSLTELWSVGRLISISVGENRVVALVCSMHTASEEWSEETNNTIRIEVELMGEVYIGPDGREEFSAGISRYPYLGAIAHRIRASDLARIYDSKQADSCVIGKLTQDESLDATIHVPSMLAKHFAIVGTTGVGKSTAVTLLLNKAIAADPKLRVLILDPHNEFAAAFPEHAVVIDTDTLELPFWLFRLEELAEVIFRGRPPVAEELDILRDVIPDAKKAFKGGESGLMRRQTEKSSITADTPVPFRMADLLAMIEERIGRLEGRTDKPHLRSLKVRIASAINDPRYHFMFSSNTITDTIQDTIARIFRIPGEGKPVATFELAGIPSEVVNSVASVLCRMAFEIGLWSNGGIHMLVVCEEAHRYVPADPSFGFLPTRQAIARIAKEGRKYGVSLGIITQRPGELDPTILSQCSTVFAMRLANDRDQEIIRSAISNSSISTTSFISSIGNGEAIAFGEAVAVPMRMRFSRVEEARLPRAHGITDRVEEDAPPVDLRSIVSRMRAMNGPDISSFQQSYLAAESAHTLADEEEGWEEPSGEIAPSPAEGMQEPALESYRPDMLPHAPEPVNPQLERFNQIREQILFGQAERDTARHRPPVQPERSFGSPAPEAQRQGSLRESLLKRPLGSIIRK
ncbi:ATP-binding protein [Sinorhizobium alkalisoli]|uniref:ATPase n=1 Tax=Sinorhizobium alkalisoli TaxID=1752398 RepID=A0A1E3V549_9HYPH|nr:ATP-binding protein [Sinorhizobium alkalisoli]MCA1491711.1 ATP-binding protein [Ensifer sp. NBAIM29]MCG5480023.1 ATP-binding protein [Sinorhizobium alkalisoli]ODR88271.1 ATPase [Sinorhizobium alkalisoli]QFI66988.1 Bipolar DNA helicase HerA [Sinorhizobium alkalisoli]